MASFLFFKTTTMNDAPFDPPPLLSTHHIINNLAINFNSFIINIPGFV